MTFSDCLGGWMPALLAAALLMVLGPAARADDRLRVIIETDAGGDPDDEQSLVRFLLYANEWDVEGIIANRPTARDGENKNPERTGLGIVRRLIEAYGQCYPNSIKHDRRYPTTEYLLRRTVAGYNDTDEAVNLIISAGDSLDSRPIWYSDWGTDHGASVNNLKRALDKILRDRGAAGYARFKSRIRLSSANAFGDHTSSISPPFPIWVDTFRPERDGKRWYHRFSALTAKAGRFDVKRDLLSGHGPLGALYPTNTTHPQKEGDSMSFLYLVPTGMNDPEHPGWGSWAGRYGRNENEEGRPYYWANQEDAWHSGKSRDNTLARWAEHLQNDFRARLEWCVKPYDRANHRPIAVLNGEAGASIQHTYSPAGSTVLLGASGSTDPDKNKLAYEWTVYPEAGSYRGQVSIASELTENAVLAVPSDGVGKTIHVILTVTDDGQPPLVAYRRIIIHVTSPLRASGP